MWIGATIIQQINNIYVKFRPLAVSKCMLLVPSYGSVRVLYLSLRKEITATLEQRCNGNYRGRLPQLYILGS